MRPSILGALLILSTLFPLDRLAARTTEREDPAVQEVVLDFEPVQIAGPFEFPWSIAFLPDGSMLVTERAGRLQLVAPGAAAREVMGVPPVLYQGTAGLLDVVIDPGFAKNGIVYLSYVHGTKASSTLRVLKVKLNGPRKALVKGTVIFESTPAPKTEHYGGRMVVTDEGYLFLTLGDRWDAERAQDLSDHAGSIIRIRTDGSIPGDNPFVSVAGAKPEIWSYGHRNPQGLALDPRTGRLWSHEHGPLGGDELNLILPGRNYGWPVITYGLEYSGGADGGGGGQGGNGAASPLLVTRHRAVRSRARGGGPQHDLLDRSPRGALARQIGDAG
jgi:glucose/arabinose dehydrogenase